MSTNDKHPEDIGVGKRTAIKMGVSFAEKKFDGQLDFKIEGKEAYNVLNSAHKISDAYPDMDANEAMQFLQAHLSVSLKAARYEQSGGKIDLREQQDLDFEKARIEKAFPELSKHIEFETIASGKNASSQDVVVNLKVNPVTGPPRDPIPLRVTSQPDGTYDLRIGDERDGMDMRVDDKIQFLEQEIEKIMPGFQSSAGPKDLIRGALSGDHGEDIKKQMEDKLDEANQKFPDSMYVTPALINTELGAQISEERSVVPDGVISHSSLEEAGLTQDSQIVAQADSPQGGSLPEAQAQVELDRQRELEQQQQLQQQQQMAMNADMNNAPQLSQNMS